MNFDDGSQVIVRRRGLTMTVRIFGADSFDTLGAQKINWNHFKFHYHQEMQALSSSQRHRTSSTKGTFCSGREKLFHVCRSRRGCPLIKWSHTYIYHSSSSFFKTIADVYCSTSSSRHLNFVYLQGLSGRWRRGMVRDVLWKGYRSVSYFVTYLFLFFFRYSSVGSLDEELERKRRRW